MIEIMELEFNDEEKSALAAVFEKAKERIEGSEYSGKIIALQSALEYKDNLLQTALGTIDRLNLELGIKKQHIENLGQEIRSRDATIERFSEFSREAKNSLCQKDEEVVKLQHELQSLQSDFNLLAETLKKRQANVLDNDGMRGDSVNDKPRSWDVSVKDALNITKGWSDNNHGMKDTDKITVGNNVKTKTNILHAFKFRKNAVDAFNKRINDLKEINPMIIDFSNKSSLEISLDDGRVEYFKSLEKNDNLYSMRGMMFSRIISHDIFDEAINNELKRFLII